MFSQFFVSQVSLNEDLPKDSWLAKLPVVKSLQSRGGLEFDTPVTFFMGENGAGKSTLIEAIAVSLGFNPEGGTVNFNFSTNDSHSPLHRYITVSKGVKRHKDGYFLRAESFYNAASFIQQLQSDPTFLAYGDKSLHDMSHGESFLTLVETRFSKNGLYILDEPEAALSPTGIMRLMVTIDRLSKEGAQFIISTHSPILTALPGAAVYQIDSEGINRVNWNETEHFVLTKQFLNDPDRMLKYLLD